MNITQDGWQFVTLHFKPGTLSDTSFWIRSDEVISEVAFGLFHQYADRVFAYSIHEIDGSNTPAKLTGKVVPFSPPKEQ
jgi:hypothetical protein